MTSRELKRGIIILVTSIVLLKYASGETYYEPEYEIVGSDEKNKPFASYEDVDVYIGDETYIENISEKINEEDILVLDKRESNDPNMIIYDSYRIHDAKTMNALLEILAEYERLYPTEWQRTIESMEKEWKIHNICYYLSYERERTKDVDFNNNDEENYNPLVLTRSLKNKRK